MRRRFRMKPWVMAALFTTVVLFMSDSSAFAADAKANEDPTLAKQADLLDPLSAENQKANPGTEGKKSTTEQPTAAKPKVHKLTKAERISASPYAPVQIKKPLKSSKAASSKTSVPASSPTTAPAAPKPVTPAPKPASSPPAGGGGC